MTNTSNSRLQWLARALVADPERFRASLEDYRRIIGLTIGATEEPVDTEELSSLGEEQDLSALSKELVKRLQSAEHQGKRGTYVIVAGALWDKLASKELTGMSLEPVERDAKATLKSLYYPSENTLGI